MAIRDIVQAAAGVGGGGEYVEDVFSTYLYTGTGAAQTITNGIDLAGEGGLVWTKARNASGQDHFLADTDSPAPANPNYFIKTLTSNSTAAYQEPYRSITGWNSNGYEVERHLSFGGLNTTYASWTFRKAPKFFSVVTWTGTGVAGRTVAHDLGSVPGMIIVKRTDGAGMWRVFHRSLGATKNLYLNDTSGALTQSDIWNDTAPTDAVFTVGDSGNVNGSGLTYVAYVFAHDAGGFGDDGEQDVISCGSVVGANQQEVNLGFEPQWILLKNADSAQDWWMVDNMRGWPVQGTDTSYSARRLNANLSSAESTLSIAPSATGFKANTMTVGQTYIYMAIRRPMKPPEAGTEVFMPFAAADSTRQTTGFPTDMFLDARRSGHSLNTLVGTRLVGPTVHLVTSSTGAETTGAGSIGDAYQYNDSFKPGIGFDWWCAFKRAPSFMDVVCYTGTGVAKTEAHNLGVVPELMIVRMRSSGFQWMVYHKDLPVTGHLFFSNQGIQTDNAWNDTAPTDSVFSIKTYAGVNRSADTYVNYLFATLAGVSKVGSYTGTGADLNVDCGFSAGARFILVKRTDSTGDWYVWDSARGIVAGNDPYLLLNSTAAEVTNTDYIDPLASGFTVTSSAPAALNASGGTYIFLAIA